MRQVRKNLITNIMCLVANVLVGLLYTPYLVHELGVVTYGVLPIALVINQYIIILTDSLQNSVTRFYSVEYRQKNYEKASVYFSSAIVIPVILTAFILPITGIMMPWIENALHIPDKLISSVGYLIFYTIASLFVAVCSNCINVTIYSDNRLDLINYTKILRNLAKPLINVILFCLFVTNVSNIGLSSLLAECIVLGVSIIFYKFTKHKNICFNPRFIDFAAMKPIFKMLSWVLLISFSSVFIYKMDTIFVNNYFGLYYTGILGSISEFGVYCICITGVFGLLFRPLMLIAYSEGRHSDLVKITIDSAYIVGLLSSLLCGIVMGLSNPILKLWLNEEIAQHSLWLVIKMLIIPITTYGSVFSIVYNLWNKVKSAALWSFFIAIVYVGVSILLLESGVNMTVFLIFGSVAAISQGAILHILIYRRLYPESMSQIYMEFMKCSLFFAVVFFSSFVLEYFVQASTFYMLIVEFTISFMFALCISPLFISRRDIDALDVIFPIKTILSKFTLITKK